MRQSLAKHQRRDLRRAMGIGALSAMQEQEQAIAILSNAVASCQREIASLAIDHAEFKKRSERVDENLGENILNRYREIAKLAGDQRTLLPGQPTFLSRLRWLFNL